MEEAEQNKRDKGGLMQFEFSRLGPEDIEVLNASYESGYFTVHGVEELRQVSLKAPSVPGLLFQEIMISARQVALPPKDIRTTPQWGRVVCRNRDEFRGTILQCKVGARVVHHLYLVACKKPMWSI